MKLEDIKWCAEECHRQKSGELSVGWMCEALTFVREWTKEGWEVFPDTTLIKALGTFVEPHQNRNGFRTLPIRIGFKAIPAVDFNRQLDVLCEAYRDTDMTAPEFYYRFETLHPFLDGNGRVGSLLYNLMMGTLHGTLIVPPRYSELDIEFGYGN